jgi:hypothetical protein
MKDHSPGEFLKYLPGDIRRFGIGGHIRNPEYERTAFCRTLQIKIHIQIGGQSVQTLRLQTDFNFFTAIPPGICLIGLYINTGIAKLPLPEILLGERKRPWFVGSETSAETR